MGRKTTVSVTIDQGVSLGHPLVALGLFGRNYAYIGLALRHNRPPRCPRGLKGLDLVTIIH
jgi:hypothetical protein